VTAAGFERSVVPACAAARQPCALRARRRHARATHRSAASAASARARSRRASASATSRAAAAAPLRAIVSPRAAAAADAPRLSSASRSSNSCTSDTHRRARKSTACQPAHARVPSLQRKVSAALRWGFRSFARARCVLTVAPRAAPRLQVELEVRQQLRELRLRGRQLRLLVAQAALHSAAGRARA
jgi:hypothetical protein